jgi:hypothetical protein
MPVKTPRPVAGHEIIIAGIVKPSRRDLTPRLFRSWIDGAFKWLSVRRNYTATRNDGEREWTMERIAQALNVSQYTVSKEHWVMNGPLGVGSVFRFPLLSGL